MPSKDVIILLVMKKVVTCNDPLIHSFIHSFNKSLKLKPVQCLFGLLDSTGARTWAYDDRRRNRTTDSNSSERGRHKHPL